ncbi:MAG: hypothetical protein V1760_00275, partial [Candidatus Peregrinibacteria bacterium]
MNTLSLSAADLTALFQKRLKILQPYLDQNHLEAYRLWERTPVLPAAIDMYGDRAVIHVFEEGAIPSIAPLQTALQKLLKTTAFFYKNRMPSPAPALPSSPQKQTLVVRENGHPFLINLSDYLD